jgi:hypothetical protein
MVLEMYLNNKLVDSTPLSLSKINNVEERKLYIQGAVNHLLERWDGLIEDQHLKHDFFTRTTWFAGCQDVLRS